MLCVTKKYLSSLNFSNLTNWSVQYLLDANFFYNEKYPLVKIGSFLFRNRTVVNIMPNVKYKRVTIKINNGGVHLRDIEKGENIGTKRQFIVKQGQFIFSKIDARNGAFGFVPKELDGAVVTNDFPVFDVDNKQIKTEYLVLITTTKNFIQFAQSCSSGTTNRQRIDIDSFLNQQIPLPNLDKQSQIIEEYNKRLRVAEEFERQGKYIKHEIEKFIYKELGIEVEEIDSNKKIINFIAFKNLSRWDTDFLLKKKNKIHSKYPLVTYSDIFISLKNGIAARNYAKKGFRYLKVTDIKNNMLSDNNIVYTNSCKERDILKTGMLLITRKGTVGQSYYIKNDLKGTLVASSEIFIIELADEVLGDYISEINLYSFIQNQYKEKCTGTIMPSLSQEMLKTIQIPLPPLYKQNEIVKYIDRLKAQIKELDLKAQESRKRAISDFEKEIFSLP